MPKRPTDGVAPSSCAREATTRRSTVKKVTNPLVTLSTQFAKEEQKGHVWTLSTQFAKEEQKGHVWTRSTESLSP